MSDACALMRWYLDEAVRFGQVSGMTKEMRDAELVEQFLVDQMKRVLRKELDAKDLTVNRIRRYGPGPLRGKGKDIEAALEALHDHGRIRMFKNPGSKSRNITIAPQVMMEYS